jgi:hypothetical protein
MNGNLVRTVTRDPALSARVIDRAPLYFSGGADALTDRPAHVRAGSGLARVLGALALVQDDSNFIALVDPTAPQAARAVILPPGPDGRRQFGDAIGNKHLKLDLEACFATETTEPLFVALGSGATPARETVVLISGWATGALDTRVIPAPDLYGQLRAATGFAGSELNIEGALLLGPTLRLFSRGNGAARGALQPLNATCDLPWPDVLAHLEHPAVRPAPEPTRFTKYFLGALAGVPLGFTDATAWGHRVLFTASAENSPDTVRDGHVSGSVIGFIDPAGTPRWAPITDAAGVHVPEKAEGLLMADADAAELWVVADVDDETRPSELWRVRLRGPWRD